MILTVGFCITGFRDFPVGGRVIAPGNDITYGIIIPVANQVPDKLCLLREDSPRQSRKAQGKQNEAKRSALHMSVSG